MSNGPAVSARRYREEHRSGGQLTTLQLPPHLNLMELEAKTYNLEIIPFPAGQGNPYAEPGQMTYERTYFVHRNIGSEERQQVCPAKSTGQPCPVCEHKAKLSRDENADEETVKALAAKERQLWYVYDHSEPEKGLQLLDISVHLFGKQLMAAVANAPEEDGWDYFADVTYGKTVRVSFTKKNMGRSDYLEATSVMLRNRTVGLPPDIVAAAAQYPLDNLLTIRPYQELYALFYQLDANGQPISKGPPASAPGPATVPPARQVAPPPAFAGTVPPPPPPPAAASGAFVPGAPAQVPPPPVRPAAVPPPPASAISLKKGDIINHPAHGQLEVFRVQADGVKCLNSEAEPVMVTLAELGIQAATVAPAAAPAPAAVAPPPVTTASSKGITKGTAFTHPELGACSVVKVQADDISCKVMVDATDEVVTLSAHEIACALFTGQVVGSHQEKDPEPVATAPAPPKRGRAKAPAAAPAPAPAPAQPPQAPAGEAGAGEGDWDQDWD